MVVGGSRQETLDPGFMILGTHQQGVLVILRELMLSGGFDLLLWNNLPQPMPTIKSLPLFVRCIDAYCSSENALNGLAPLSVSHSTSDILGTLNV
ncbi:unnamed protein product [Schistosoma margrebowiei]|uniref:Uncharacterized protein n=1 Tax=Schistosoma margrebowiei TaxID=48269 RepID=A0A183MGU5_9TREM|nr:unnamed protein product [Schistosoma margrebowiei]